MATKARMWLKIGRKFSATVYMSFVDVSLGEKNEVIVEAVASSWACQGIELNVVAPARERDES